MLFAKLLTQVDSIPPEYIDDTGHELSHIGAPLRMPLLGQACSRFTFCCTMGLCQVGTLSLITLIITVTYCLAVRDAGFFSARVLAVMLIYVTLVLPNVSARHALTWQHIGHDPYLPSGQSGKSTPQCQQRPASCSGKWELTTCNACSLFPSLPPEPTLRESQPHGTTCYTVATGFLHPAEPQAPLHAGYSADCLLYG